MNRWCSLLLGLSLGVPITACGSRDTGPTSLGVGASGFGLPVPQEQAGIASEYPDDIGIAGDPRVIFADGFETYAQARDLSQNWDEVFQSNRVRISSEPAHVFGGRKALEFSVPQQNAELSNAVHKVLTRELDVLFLRYYGRFEAPYDVTGSSHNGSMISGQYYVNGRATPGVPANGTNKFLVNLENWRPNRQTPSPGDLNIYVYHPEQRSQWGDHFFPTGRVLPDSSTPFDFGPTFQSRPEVVPELEQWHCYEYMVKANTPGLRDGQISVWLDGTLVAEFGNLRLRDTDRLKIDRFGLLFHVSSNPMGETRKWYDNVVAATAYIGPMYPPPGQPSVSSPR